MMKKFYNLLKFSAVFTCFIAVNAKAQTLYTYDNDESGAYGTVVTGISVSDLTPVNGIVEINACGTGYSTDTWSTSAAAFSTAYTAIQLTLTPDPGQSVTVTQLQFDLGRNPQGPQKMRYAYSTTGGASWINSGTDLTITSGSCGSGTTFIWDMTDFTTTNQILFRIYGWDASNVNGQQRTYNGIINGTVCELTTFYADADNDGFGDITSTTSACTAPLGYVADNTDCNDGSDAVYPGATEICDGLDNDCDAEIDENLITASISPADSAITCKSFPVTFSTTPCVDCTYQWFKNDNAIVGATSDTYSTTKPAYYSVQVNLPGGCFDVSDHSLLISGFNPNANIYYPNGLNLCAPTPGNNILIKVGFNAGNVYQWYKDGSPYLGDGGDSWKIYPSETGVYYCSITSVDGCNRLTENATVTNSCKLAQANDVSMVVFPNPSTTDFTISLSSASDAGKGLLNVTDLVGNIVFSENINVNNGSNTYTVNAATLANGMYFVTVILADNEYITRVMINK